MAAPVGRRWRLGYALVYLGLAAAVVVQISEFHGRRTGLTPLIRFGAQFEARRLAQLRELPIYTFPDSGYDGQFYSQLAVAGNPLDPALRTALDAPPYRSRRLLLPVAAHLVGLGQTSWVLSAYALANLTCWLVLALLLACWWFPPTGVHNLVRWTGTLFAEGNLTSVTFSLTDVPALLVIAVGVRLLERNRQRLAAVVLGAAGLVRETSILCATAFLPRLGANRNQWRGAALAAATVVLPIVAWTAFLVVYYGSHGSQRNFAPPLVNYVYRLAEIRGEWTARGGDAWVWGAVWGIVAMSTQIAFLAARPKLADPWWRVGASFALLWLCLGRAVWEGGLVPPPAASRVVLPMTLAFNVLAPRSRLGLVLLLAGNLSVLSAPALLKPPPLVE